MELWSCLRKQQKLVEQISEYGVNKVFGENKQCVIYFYFKKVKKKNGLFGQSNRFGLLFNLESK